MDNQCMSARAAGATAGHLLLIDDDENHCWALRRSFENRGYAVSTADSVRAGLALLGERRVDYAVVDLRMPGPSGLHLIAKLRAANAEMRIVVLTGYASVATAVEAIKLGATHYLVKPVDAAAVEAAFDVLQGDEEAAARQEPLSVERLAWEHIRSVLAERNGNISAAARTLGMHRRTLQRKLNKSP
jgi:two-component system, response regulator RegA